MKDRTRRAGMAEMKFLLKETKASLKAGMTKERTKIGCELHKTGPEWKNQRQVLYVGSYIDEEK